MLRKSLVSVSYPWKQAECRDPPLVETGEQTSIVENLRVHILRGYKDDEI